MRTGHSRGEKTCIDVQSGGDCHRGVTGLTVKKIVLWPQQRDGASSLSPFGSLSLRSPVSLVGSSSGRIFMGGLIRLGLDRRSGPV